MIAGLIVFCADQASQVAHLLTGQTTLLANSSDLCILLGLENFGYIFMQSQIVLCQ